MRICFIDRSTQLSTVSDLQTRARGGMVSSLFHVSNQLSRKGHHVSVFADIEEDGYTADGVDWNDIEISQPVDCDVLVFNRGIGSGLSHIKAKHRVLWTHDLPHAGFIEEPKNIKAFSAVVFMSDYAEEIWRFFCKDIGKSFKIPNGVDLELFYPRQKDTNYIIYASAPNRGLKRLPFIFDCLKTRVKRPLYMKAFSNLSTLHPNEVGENDEFQQTYKEVHESSVELHEPVPQSKLAEELGTAGLMVIPTDYPEICSNTILQSLASGTPVVTTGQLGSAGEWIENGWNGGLTRWQPNDYMAYQIDIQRCAVKILENDDLHRRMMANAANTRIYSWDEIGTQWHRMLTKL
jgi:glycosyltransferase involved in cell wall biosynthesis